jgi:hypothetical protein
MLVPDNFLSIYMKFAYCKYIDKTNTNPVHTSLINEPFVSGTLVIIILPFENSLFSSVNTVDTTNLLSIILLIEKADTESGNNKNNSFIVLDSVSVF